MEELCEPTLNGRDGPIAPITIQATNFGLKNDMIQQVQNSCQFHGLSGDDANKHLDKFLHVTQSIKVNGVTDDALRQYLFPHSLTHHATAWFDRLPRNSINTFEQMAKMFLGKYFPRHRDTINAAAGGTFMKRRPKECYDLIKNMTTHHNDWDILAQRSESSSSIIVVKPIGLKYPHHCPATAGQTQNVYAAGAYQGGFTQNKNRNNQSQNFQNQNRNQGNNHGLPQGNNQGRNQFFQGASHGQNPPPPYQAPSYQAPGYQVLVHQAPIPQPQVMNTASSSGLGTLPSNTVTNPKEDLKGITTRSGNAYQGPMIPTTSSSLPQVVECETEVTKDMVPPTNNRSTKDIQPPVVLIETPIPNSKPVVAPVCALKPNPKPSIPYPSRLHDQKLNDKANDQKEKFFQIFKDLKFNISFADALILMPKFGPTIKSLLTNKDKLFELARTPLNGHFSAVLLKKLPEKLGYPDKFLTPCDFLGMDECLALADLSASINLMPLSIWNKLSLPELTSTLMTLELADRSISRLIGVAKDVFIKVGKFHFREVDAFLAFEDDPTSSEVDHFYYDTEGDILLLEAFLNDDPSLPSHSRNTGRALMDFYAGELTL
nr:reverse transcriptase domain-containing protein [Tanacetum cinerariifolium]